MTWVSRKQREFKENVFVFDDEEELEEEEDEESGTEDENTDDESTDSDTDEGSDRGDKNCPPNNFFKFLFTKERKKNDIEKKTTMINTNLLLH